jgi:uncharacterized protein
MATLDHSEDYLTRDEGRLLLAIARDALNAWLSREEKLDLREYALTDPLREKHGAFVTLRWHGQLRGCIGYTANLEPLAATVRDNAVNAATRDFRFPPVERGELDEMTIEVSALTPGDSPDTPFKAVKDIGEIIIGRDGLYIEKPPSRGGLLLPQVAAEEGWDVPTFLSCVCRKAGYPDKSWEQPGVRLYRFSAQVFSERTLGEG